MNTQGPIPQHHFGFTIVNAKGEQSKFCGGSAETPHGARRIANHFAEYVVVEQRYPCALGKPCRVVDLTFDPEPWCHLG